MRLRKDTMMAELAMATIEQPSPVSVLDATFYIEDSPSPVKKKISIAFGGNNHIPQNMYFQSKLQLE